MPTLGHRFAHRWAFPQPVCPASIDLLFLFACSVHVRLLAVLFAASLGLGRLLACYGLNRMIIMRPRPENHCKRKAAILRIPMVLHLSADGIKTSLLVDHKVYIINLITMITCVPYFPSALHSPIISCSHCGRAISPPRQNYAKYRRLTIPFVITPGRKLVANSKFSLQSLARVLIHVILSVSSQGRSISFLFIRASSHAKPNEIQSHLTSSN